MFIYKHFTHRYFMIFRIKIKIHKPGMLSIRKYSEKLLLELFYHIIINKPCLI